MTRKFAVLVVSAFLLLFAATPILAQDEPTSQPTSQPTEEAAAEQARHEAMQAMCPMHVEGTEITLEETPNGAAMSFVNAAQPADLRERIHRMAAYHNEHHAEGSGNAMPASQASVQDTEFGALLVLTPVDPSQEAALEQYLADHAAELAEGSCPMGIMWGGHGAAGEGEGEAAPGAE